MQACIDHGQAGNAHGGYGNTTYLGRQTPAHRAAYMRAYGLVHDDLRGLVVRHTCDNPRCINPAHLLQGTRKDNSRDAIERGRVAAGERNGRCSVTDQQWVDTLGMTVTEAANKLGISHQAVSARRKRIAQTKGR